MDSRRILSELLTTWDADAWEKIKKQPDMIKHFLKCGLTNNLDSTEGNQTKIREIEDYTVPSAVREFPLLEDDEESRSESEFYGG